MRAFARFVLRHAGWVAIAGTLLALVGSYFTVLLYKNLRTDLQELLPTTARSVVDLNEVSRRLNAIDNLVVLIFCPDVAAGTRFQVDLAKKLETFPKNVVAGVEYRIDREIKFFKEREPLFIDLADLLRIRGFITERLDYERALYNPLTIVSGKNIAEPKLDFQTLKDKYLNRVGGFDHFPNGYYAMPDGKLRVVVVDMPGRSSDIAAAMRLKKAISDSVEALGPKSYSPQLEVKYTGNVQNLIEENDALVADLVLSTVIVTLLVTFVMIAYYRTFTGVMALVWSLFMGTFWTFGISYFTVGYLNANSAFMASIVVGNGINFGIIYLARYMEERRKRKRPVRAAWIAAEKTATSTFTAAMAAGLSYGSLMLTAFRGSQQFGVIGFTGMILCWVSAFTLLPAFLVLWERWVPIDAKPLRNSKYSLPNLVAAFVERWPRQIWVASAVCVALALTTLPSFKQGIIEMDLTKLRNKWSMEHGSGSLYHYIHDVFRRYLSPVVILPRTRADTEAIARRLREIQEHQGKDGYIANVQTIESFAPLHQEEKIRVLRQIRRELPPRLLDRLPADDQALARELLSPQAFYPFSEKQLPPLIISKFTEKDGSIGKMILVDNVEGRGGDNAEQILEYVGILRNAADSVVPGTPVAGGLPITADMVEAIMRDGPRATAFAFLAVIVLVVMLFRNLRTIALCLFSLSVGVVWLTGLILHFHLKINFLNFIALPITFGIGVDYGVNIFQRYREEGRGSIANVIRHTGGAVMLASSTTIIGYASLLIAGNQAFVSFGRLAVLGEITCVTAAVVSLPAFLRTRDAIRGTEKA